jgi:hypothetical protein
MVERFMLVVKLGRGAPDSMWEVVEGSLPPRLLLPLLLLMIVEALVAALVE